MRHALAAALAVFLGAPALADSASTVRVGLVVTGSFVSALAGAWYSRSAARGMYHFVMRGSSGTFYELVSIPLEGRTAGKCDLRVGGVVHSLEQVSGGAPTYEMRYSIQSADVVTSSTNVRDCRDVAASYLSELSAAEGTRSMILSRAGERLIDGATGAEYVRTR